MRIRQPHRHKTVRKTHPADCPSVPSLQSRAMQQKTEQKSERYCTVVLPGAGRAVADVAYYDYHGLKER